LALLEAGVHSIAMSGAITNAVDKQQVVKEIESITVSRFTINH
jgi:thiamine monophosphate synthase